MNIKAALASFFESLISAMISRPKWAYILTAGIAVAGLLALSQMKRDLVPSFDFKNITVTVLFPGVSGPELERILTYPLEEKLMEISNLERISSRTQTGSVTLNLGFEDSVSDLRLGEAEVRAKISEWQQQFRAGEIQVSVSSTLDDNNKVFLANYALVGFEEKNPNHQAWVQGVIQELDAIKGVSSVSSSVRPLNLYVRFDPKKLQDLKISPQHIRRSIENYFQFQSIGYYNSQGKEWLLQMEKPSFSVEQLQNLSLFENSDGKNLLLKDVAVVEKDLPPHSRYSFLLNGKSAVELVLFKDAESDSLDVFAEVEKKMKSVSFPEGVRADLLYDGPYFIKQQISVLLSNGFGGLVLVLLMLGLAMSFKTSLMTAIGLPISYFGTFVILYFAGASIDLISLIAMILVVGNLVDDAVIMSERYTQLLEEGLSPQSAAKQSATELIVPVTGTILTIICAFAPIVFLGGGLSKVFFYIPIVVGAALALSWFETFFILPSHLAHHVKKPPRMLSQKLFFSLARGYRRILSHTLKWRYAYGLASLALLGGTLWQASRMSQDFSLHINAPQVEIFAEFPVETTLDQSEQYLTPLHEEILKLQSSDVDFLETHLGWSWRQGKSYSGPRYASVRVVLNKQLLQPKDAQARVTQAITPVIERLKKDHPHFVLLDLEANLRGGSERVSETATVTVRGKEDVLFSKAESSIIQVLENQGLVGAFIVPDNKLPQSWVFSPDLGRHQALGLSLSESAGQIQALTTSVRVEQIRDQGSWREVYLEPSVLSEPSKSTLSQMSLIHPVRESLVPLSYLGTWAQVQPNSGIDHDQGQRLLKIQFKFDQEKTNEQVVQKQIEDRLQEIRTEFPSLQIKVEDSNERDKKGREWILEIVMISAVLIFFILFAVHGSWTLPLIVGLPIPFAMVGVIWALKLHNLPLGLMSMIGLIGTMGVAVNDSIVMVDQIQRLKKKYGKLTQEILVEGASSRLRAITLTATCTLIGVFPTAYGLGGESGFTQPLAFAMGWGLTTSLALTLFIIPAMIWVREDLMSLFQRRFHKISASKKINEGQLKQTLHDQYHKSYSDRSVDIPPGQPGYKPHS